jgi:hypothetical protein
VRMGRAAGCVQHPAPLALRGESASYRRPASAGASARPQASPGPCSEDRPSCACPTGPGREADPDRAVAGCIFSLA